jgi:hypothetical protein
MENMEESPDTLGEFIFGPVPQIDSIVFAHSNTGSKRGIRIYKSSDGETWENASPDDEFWDGEDCQLGDVNTVVIDATNVYIKFTSGFKQSDLTSQFSRLHNIDVYGTPGTLSYNVDKIRQPDVKIYYNNGSDLLIVNGKVNTINIYDPLGKLIRTVQEKDISSVNISDLRRSLYIIEAFDDENNRIVEKIIK